MPNRLTYLAVVGHFAAEVNFRLCVNVGPQPGIPPAVLRLDEFSDERTEPHRCERRAHPGASPSGPAGYDVTTPDHVPSWRRSEAHCDRRSRLHAKKKLTRSFAWVSLEGVDRCRCAIVRFARHGADARRKSHRAWTFRPASDRHRRMRSLEDTRQTEKQPLIACRSGPSRLAYVGITQYTRRSLKAIGGLPCVYPHALPECLSAYRIDLRAR